MNGHVVYGQALFDAGRYDEAETTFNTALGLDPENLIALRHLGDIARLNGDAPKAIQWYTRVLEADPRNGEILAYIEELKVAVPPASSAAGAESATQPAPIPTPPPSAPADRPSAQTPRVSQAPVTPPAFGDANTVEIAAQVPTSATPTPIAPIAPIAPVAPVAPKRPSVPLMDLDLDVTAGAEEPPPPPRASGPASVGSAGVPVLGDIEFTDIGAPNDEPGALIGGLESTGLESTGLESTGLESTGLESTGLESTGLESAGLESAGLESTGLDPVGIGSTGEDVALDPVLDGAGDSTLAPASPPPADGLELDTGLGWDLPDALPAPAPASEAAAPAEGVEPPAVFLTETMAELYLQQGFRDEALEVYRKLAAQNPDDKNLQERVRSLESGKRASLSLEAVSDEVPEFAPGTEPLVVMKESDAAPVVAGAPEVSGTAEAAAPERRRGPTARSFFAALAQRRPVRPDGTAPAGIAAVPSAPPERSSGSLDALFSEAPSEADDAMGAALATAVGHVESAPAIHGRPTQPAESDLSLDAVFRGDAGRRASAEVPRQSQHLKFDQFFATASSDVGAPPPAAPADPETASTDDAQFQSWLKGLKGQ
jgi:tetratricopeptide (TPR) repeat protein